MTRNLEPEDEHALVMIRAAKLQPTIANVAALGGRIYDEACQLDAEAEHPANLNYGAAAKSIEKRIGGLQFLDKFLAEGGRS